MDESSQRLTIIMSDLNRIEREGKDFESLSVAYGKWYREHVVTLTTANDKTWLQQLYAMRRFGLAIQFDRPIVERENVFQQLCDIGFPDVPSQFSVLRLRAVYLLDVGNVEEASNVIREMKQFVHTVDKSKLVTGWRAMLEDLERRLA